jgi:hypothetical protein
MFEVKKEDLKVKSVIDYPITKATAERFISVNGLTYYFFGDSKVECDKGDKFEFAFGKELAETNATIDMLRNYKSFLIRQTKQPEWRKEPKKKEYVVEPKSNHNDSDMSVNMFNNNLDKKIRFTAEILETKLSES